VLGRDYFITDKAKILICQEGKYNDVTGKAHDPRLTSKGERGAVFILFGSFLLIFDSKVEECEVDEVCVDQENKVVTTPAFMYDATFAQVWESI
jgi:hypothetical protein